MPIMLLLKWRMRISFWLAKFLKSVSSGSVELFATDKPALKIEVINNKDINKK
jgi:hypothetical protein